MNVNKSQNISFGAYVTTNLTGDSKKAVQPLIDGLSKFGGDEYMHKVTMIPGYNLCLSTIDLTKGLRHIVRSTAILSSNPAKSRSQKQLLKWAAKFDYPVPKKENVKPAYNPEQIKEPELELVG